MTVLLPSGPTTLTWTAPTEDENNEPLIDLAGFNIHCWTDQFTNSFHIDDPETTSYVIEDLAPGTYYCAVSAINADGLESVLSNLVTKTVR